jgi:hypothetical protein
LPNVYISTQLLPHFAATFLIMSDDHLGMDSPGSPGSEGPNLLREQDRYLPIANISRIMKKALPANAKIAKDAKETVQECVSEFISFITSEYVPASCVLFPPPLRLTLLLLLSQGERQMPIGEAQNHQRRRHPFGDGHPRL